MPADEADMAEQAMAQLLELHLRVRKPELERNHRCHNCAAWILDGAFCDALCREDWEHRNVRKAINLSGD